MPRHFSANSWPRRWILAAIFLVLATALAGGGVGLFVAVGATDQAASSPDASNATTTPGTTPSLPPTPSAKATPTPAVPPKPVLTPDFVLPPITNGLAPVLTKIPTEQKVVFLTIDDGANKTPAELQILKDNHIKASLFLAQTFILDNPDFFKSFVASGSRIENHTLSHQLNFIKLSYAQQKAEICGMADYIEKTYGRRPVFFRPPGGPYTDSVRKAVADCGMKAVIDWEAKANAGGMDYQVGKALRPGDIVLMHFRPEFAADMAAFLAAQKAAGLEVALLEDYLATG